MNFVTAASASAVKTGEPVKDVVASTIAAPPERALPLPGSPEDVMAAVFAGPLAA